MTDDSQYIPMAYHSIGVFSDDGKMDIGELNFLLGMALADDKIDDDEKRVLRNIFKRVGKSDVSDTVWSRIKEIRRKYDV